MNKNVLVLIVTWNGAGVIRRCLNSLRRSVMPIVIYVVDNNSDAETVRIIQEEYPEVILHINSDNIGFGQANNIGLRYAAQNGFDHVVYTNLKVYHFLIKKCTTPNRLQRYA